MIRSRIKNWLLAVTDPEIVHISRIIRNSIKSRGTVGSLVMDCDKVFVQRLKDYPVAFKMSFWENHFEWKGLTAYPELSGHILDFGCGSGHSDIYLARNGFRVHGVDLSPVGIAIAAYLQGKESRDVRERLSFEVVDITAQRREATLYDAAWSSHVFEHISDPVPILKGLKRWLKPGAHLLISVPLGYAFDDPGHVNHFANGEELRRFLGDTVTVLRIDISMEFQVIRALCRF